MAKLVFGMNMSLDGYVDHMAFVPEPAMFRYFIGQVAGATGSIYGRTMYEVMRYWDEDHAEWGADQREFAEAWRRQTKWVVSRTLTSAGPNAILIRENVENAIRRIKAEQEGEIGIAGTLLAHSMAGLIDAYRLYVHPVVLGGGKPFFAGPRPPLRLVASDRIGESVIRLIYVPA